LLEVESGGLVPGFAHRGIEPPVTVAANVPFLRNTVEECEFRIYRGPASLEILTMLILSFIVPRFFKILLQCEFNCDSG
jgi:hypothetical protein